MLVLFHGLEGSSQSHYARAFGHWALQQGYAYVVPHFRGCSGEPNSGPRFYHSGDHAEINWILQRALTEFSDETIRQTIKTIALGKLAIAVEYLEELIARASAVPPHTSNLEECTASFAR